MDENKSLSWVYETFILQNNNGIFPTRIDFEATEKYGPMEEQNPCLRCTNKTFTLQKQERHISNNFGITLLHYWKPFSGGQIYFQVSIGRDFGALKGLRSPVIHKKKYGQ